MTRKGVLRFLVMAAVALMAGARGDLFTLVMVVLYIGLGTTNTD